jgi:hypothetical protein
MSLHAFTITTYVQMLGALSGWLDKGAEKGGEAILEAKLADDMLPLSAQVRIACDQANGLVKRVTTKSLVLSDDNDTTMAAAKERIATTIAFLKTVTEADIAKPDSPVALDLPNGMAFDFTALEYARDWSLAQFYFHVNMAYAILRKEGVPLGKIDYLSYGLHYMRKAPAAA